MYYYLTTQGGSYEFLVYVLLAILAVSDIVLFFVSFSETSTPMKVLQVLFLCCIISIPVVINVSKGVVDSAVIEIEGLLKQELEKNYDGKLVTGYEVFKLANTPAINETLKLELPSEIKETSVYSLRVYYDGKGKLVKTEVIEKEEESDGTVQ